MSDSRNPLHTVSCGDKIPEVVNAIIEIPTGCKAKYEIDKESGLLRLDRVLYSAVHYPANYGFIPQTHCEDGDPLDVLVLSQLAVVPMCLLECRPIGVMKMIDNGEADDKIIAVAIGDMNVDHLHDLSDLPKPRLRELQRFFEDYKKLENKHVEITEVLGKEAAFQAVHEGIALYKKEFR